MTVFTHIVAPILGVIFITGSSVLLWFAGRRARQGDQLGHENYLGDLDLVGDEWVVRRPVVDFEDAAFQWPRSESFQTPAHTVRRGDRRARYTDRVRA